MPNISQLNMSIIIIIINQFLRIIYVFYIMIVLCNHMGNGLFMSDLLNNLKNNIVYYSISPLMETCDTRWVPQDLLSK